MDSVSTQILEIERTISDLEEKIKKKKVKAPFSAGIQVVWKSLDPSDVWPLIASLGDTRVFDLSKRVLLKNARNIPLTLRYADTCRIHLRLKSDAGEKKLRVFDDNGIDPEMIDKNIASGNLILGTDAEPPWKLKDTSAVLHVLQEILIDDPMNSPGFITSALFEAPFQQLRNIEILINPKKLKNKADAVLICFLPEKLTSEVLNSLKSMFHDPYVTPVVPILCLPWNSLQEKGNIYSDQAQLRQLLDDVDQSLRKLKAVDVFPGLPVYRTSFSHSDAGTETYEALCMDLLWRTIRSAGYNVSNRHNTIQHRFEEIAATAMVAPTSIIGLLRQMSHLKMLQAVSTFKVSVPETGEFISLRDRGVLVYSELAKKSFKLSKKKTEEEVVIRYETASLALQKFLGKALNCDCLTIERDELLKLSEEYEKSMVSGKRPELEKYVNSIDSVMDHAGKQIAIREKELRIRTCELQKLKDRPLLTLDAEKRDELDHIQFFWREFVPLSLKKIKIKQPVNEIKEICSKTTVDFNDYIALTPADANELNKCKNEKWPSLAKKCTKKVNAILEDTVEIWQIVVSQEFSNLEDFRKENLPRESKISSNIRINPGKLPVLKDSLDLNIKKPGFKKLLFSSSELEKWRAQAVEQLTKVVNLAMETYLSEIEKRLKSILGNIEKTIADMEESARKNLKTAEQKLKKLESQLEKSEFERKQKISNHEKEQNVFAKLQDSFKIMKQDWEKVKNNSISGIL